VTSSQSVLRLQSLQDDRLDVADRTRLWPTVSTGVVVARRGDSRHHGVVNGARSARKEGGLHSPIDGSVGAVIKPRSGCVAVTRASPQAGQGSTTSCSSTPTLSTTRYTCARTGGSVLLLTTTAGRPSAARYMQVGPGDTDLIPITPPRKPSAARYMQVGPRDTNLILTTPPRKPSAGRGR